ncbi:o-succinylbenzoate--CoA ligase [Vibrio genomosp. F10]|uniref:o-succinylbenzoate--CoA ligase n=1 Tax=Vibrio genomosp. F10 TaxID=723171 RepID=UPI00030D483F|nr:o-succinylbenzoate--CoA ligase [Vibrio genomosp. F10]OEE98153.1 o-succinylbenzoate--CoA ligase [Vibrio genomosp. F10 str. 9ZD137]
MSTTSLSIQRWAQQSPLSCALVTPTRRYNWHELWQEVLAYAHQLNAQGVERSDVVTIVGKNQPEIVFVYLACCHIGAIGALTMPQPLALLQQKFERLYKREARPLVWLTDTVWQSFTVEEQQTLHTLCTRLVINENQSDNGISVDGGNLVDSVNTKNIASIIFTSGSTGAPKALAHSFAQHFASASGLLQEFDYGFGDTWLLSLPLYHVSGLAILYRWLSAGGCLKVGKGNLNLDIKDVTHASLVSTQLSRLIEMKQPLTLTRVLLGGSHIPESLTAQCAKLHIDAWLGYGMTEAASTVTAKRVNNSSTAGCVIPNRKLKIENQRIFVGGDTLAAGYFFQGNITPIIDNDGWFDTKDLGCWENNELRVIGRVDNQFISGGENIHCEQIEAELNRHPVINQAFVVPVTDKEFGYRPVAIIDAESLPSKIEMDVFLKKRLEKFKWPVAYYLIPPELFASGIKVSRKQLKQWLEVQVRS